MERNRVLPKAFNRIHVFEKQTLTNGAFLIVFVVWRRPWVIRTDPKERGFEYVSGVKRQAGQDRNLVEEGASSAVDVTRFESSQKSSLDNLEAAVVAKKTLKRPLTDIEELEGLFKLNQSANAGGKDVDHNASIRKSFRNDRREKRKKLVGGLKLGWKGGMALLPANDSDVLLSKEACYGRASVQERSKLSRVRNSSIFGSSRKSKDKRKINRRSSGNSVTPEIVGSCSVPDSVPSERELLEDLPEPEPAKISSSSSIFSSSTSIQKKIECLSSNGVVSVAGRTSNEESIPLATSQSDESNDASRSEKASDTKSSIKNTPIEELGVCERPVLSFQDLMDAYTSSDEEEEG